MPHSGGTESTTGDTRPPASVRAVPQWHTVVAIIAGILCGVGGLLIGVLFFQFVEVYFTIGGPATVNDGDVGRYEVTALICVTALAAAASAALVSKRWALAWISGVLLVIGLVVALVFSVPQNRWLLVDEPAPLPSDYTPCFSGSGPCPGGG
ncbi:MAG: DUF6234 family protein [Mycetocola sp.]